MLRLDIGIYDTEESKDLQKLITEKVKENKNTIEIDLRDKLVPVPRVTSYVYCNQRTDVWYALRNFKVTGRDYGRDLWRLLGMMTLRRIYQEFKIQNIQRVRLGRLLAGQIGFFIHPMFLTLGQVQMQSVHLEYCLR